VCGTKGVAEGRPCYGRHHDRYTFVDSRSLAWRAGSLLEPAGIPAASLLPRTTSCPGIPAPGTGARFLSPAGSEAGAHHHGVPLEPRGSIDVCQDPTYSLYMKPVQVMLDERLLEELDATEEVAREGRSAVLRRALEDYLRRRRLVTIRERYERAYGAEPGLGEDFVGWTEEGTWPEE